MLIDSDFHDYYDSVLRVSGVDKTCPYLRKTSSIDFKVKDSWQKEESTTGVLFRKLGESTIYFDGKSRWTQREFIGRAVVAFAGNFYPMVKIPKPNGYKKTIVYDLDEATHMLRERFPKHMAKIEKGRKQDIRWLDGAHPDKLADFFDQSQWAPLEYLFREHNSPVLLIEGDWGSERTLTINPVLKKIKFMKVKDTYTAFQEIHTFLSGVLGVGEPMTAEVGNDDRVKQRGFNKESFRKAPGKKKK
jgi:hypothetical protein